MADSWERLKQECGVCRGCALADTRTHVVFGDGCETAEIMLIGEGPGQHEDEQGIPFVGRAGQLLDDMLEIIHLDRTKVYIANVVKCRPPQNRDPLNVEQDACIGYLRRQAALMKPKIIVCLGRIAAKAIITGARPVVPAGRRPDDGHLSPGGAAAGRAEAPGDLSGFKKYSGQGPGAVRVY